MTYQIQLLLNNNPYLKRFLRENSWYYKNLMRNPMFVHELNSLMKKEYHQTIPDKIGKIEKDISMVNDIIDILK